MGTNRRYPGLAVGRAIEREASEAMRAHQPVLLTPAELELDLRPVTKPPKPERAKAWVRYGDTAVMVDVEIVAWTAYAVAARWTTSEGRHDRGWLWSSAVRTGRYQQVRD